MVANVEDDCRLGSLSGSSSIRDTDLGRVPCGVLSDLSSGSEHPLLIWETGLFRCSPGCSSSSVSNAISSQYPKWTRLLPESVVAVDSVDSVEVKCLIDIRLLLRLFSTSAGELYAEELVVELCLRRLFWAACLARVLSRLSKQHRYS